MNPSTKQFLLRTAKRIGMFRYTREKYRDWLRILSYHGVGDDVTPEFNTDGFMVPEPVFESHLRVLREEGYNVLPLSSTAQKLVDEELYDDHTVAITFDDGYYNNYETAATILSSHNLPATFFPTTSYLDGTNYPWWWVLRKLYSQRPDTYQGLSLAALEARLRDTSEIQRREQLQQAGIDCHWSEGLPRMMSWDDLGVLARQGYEIGGHTVNHISFGHEDISVIAQEVSQSLSELRSHGITPCPCYAYPYGSRQNVRFDDHLFERHHIPLAVTDEGGMNCCLTFPLLLKRMGMTANHDALAFEAEVSGFKYHIQQRMKK